MKQQMSKLLWKAFPFSLLHAATASVKQNSIQELRMANGRDDDKCNVIKPYYVSGTLLRILFVIT